MKHFVNLTLLLAVFCYYAIQDVRGSSNITFEDKRIVSTAELVDMIEKERNKKSANANPRHHVKNIVNITSTVPSTVTEIDDEGERLHRRKVWGRWGRWGGCSATCGGGVMVRGRQCVAGRCAPGEREEQRRPCFAPPCDNYS